MFVVLSLLFLETLAIGRGLLDSFFFFEITKCRSGSPDPFWCSVELVALSEREWEDSVENEGTELPLVQRLRRRCPWDELTYSLIWSRVWLECAIWRRCKDGKIKSLPSSLCLKRRQMFRVMEYSHYWDHEIHSKHWEWESGKPSHWSSELRFEVGKGICQGWNSSGRGNSTHKGKNARKHVSHGEGRKAHEALSMWEK